MYTLEEKLDDISINDLYRAWNTDKEYIVIDISVFNIGAVYTVICTNNYNRYATICDDGYSFILENESEVHYTIEAMLLKKLESINKAWLKYCYDYACFGDFLKEYKINEYRYSQLLKLQKNSIVNF